MCPSYLATREEKDSTRGRAHVLQDVVQRRARLRRPGRRRRARPLPVLQGLRQRLPDRHRHGDVQVRGAVPEVRRRARLPAPPALAPRARPAPALGPDDPAAAGQRDAAQQAIGRVAKAAAGVDQRRSLPAFSERPLRSGAARTVPTDVDVWIWADSFTDRFAADTGRAALELLGSMGLRAAVIPEPACCGLTWITTGQLERRPPDRRPGGGDAARLRRQRHPGDRASSRAASPRSARTPASCSTTRGRPRSAPGVRSLAEFLAGAGRRRGAGPRPT